MSKLAHSRCASARRLRPSCRLGFEPLEPRLVLSATVVLPLDVLQLREAHLAGITGTQTDIGSVEQIFDGDRNSLMRTANIDPAVIDLSFASPQTLRGFRVYTSQPQHQWRVQSADTLADLNNQTGSYAELVPWKLTSGDEYSSATLAAPDTALFLRLTVERLAGDNFVHVYEWEVIGDVTVETLEVTPSPLVVEEFSTVQLVAEGTTADGIAYPLSTLVSWESSNAEVASVSPSGLVAGVSAGSAEISATLGELEAKTQASVTPFDPEPTDLNVTYIGRTPRYNYDVAKNNPAPGDLATFEAHVRNWGDLPVASAAYRWEIDGVVVAEGAVANLLGREERIVSLPWNWLAGEHTVKFTIDPLNAIAETSETNNAVENRTDGISVGFWVEQSVYDYFQANQRHLGVGANSWEDWAQRQMARWNQAAAAAVTTEAPRGSTDRVRIDKVVVVPDGALPLAGGLPTNNPNLNDRTVDMMWGFPATLLNGSFYADATTVSDANAFYIEPSLVHELGHARYLIDHYGFDVHNTASHASVQILENGQPVAGSALMPFLAFGEALYYNRYGGLMGGPYAGWSPHETAALNRIAGERASQGNYNAPGNIGEYLDDLPSRSRVQFLQEDGTPAAGADVKLFRSAPTPGLYAKTFDSTPEMQLTADASGEIVLPRNPFRSGGGEIRSPEQGIAILRVELDGKVWYHFLEVAPLNLEFWRGHTAEGRHVIELPGPGNTRTARDIAIEGLNKPVTRGSTQAQPANGTDFGARPLNAPGTPAEFIVKNEGGQTLSLTGTVRVAITGPAAADFVVTQQPGATVAPGSLQAFRVQFTPHGVGERLATIAIASNDPDEPSFTFAIRGVGLAPGDYDANGRVDGNDFLYWQRTLGTVAVPPGTGADGDLNGGVDDKDLGVWRVNFGPPPATAAESWSAPSIASQPTAWGWLAMSTNVAASPNAGRESRPALKPARDAAFAEIEITTPRRPKSPMPGGGEGRPSHASNGADISAEEHDGSDDPTLDESAEALGTPR